MMESNRVILKVENLSAGYGQGEVIKGVTFEVEAGDFIGLAGPNGAGKSTLMKVILGLISPSSGTISLFGEDIRSFRGWNLIGYLPQRATSYNPLFPASVREVVSLGLLSRKRFPKSLSRKDMVLVDEAMERLGITSLGDGTVGELSGGQQQKVFLARALVSKPRLLVLDEPSTALDPQSRASFYEMIKSFNVHDGITVIMITHDTGNIGEHAKKLLYLDGELVFYGSFGEFCESERMNEYFGGFFQHIICHRHR
jgi:zinc transport system ATP-binding protein